MNEELTDIDILSISKEASAHKKKDNKVINAVLGILIDEEGNFLTLKSVDESFEDIDKDIVRMYMPVDGGELYKRNLYQYLFKTHLDELKKTFHVASNWSSGGSGALNMAFQLHRGAVLLPDIRWHEYDQIAKHTQLSVVEYTLFKENKFNIEGLKTQFKTHRSLLFVLNDPAHNPTGYSLTVEEYQILFQSLKENPHVKLLLDIAYFDFSNDYFKTLIPLIIEYNIPVMIAFSGSKSFLVYGVRMGSLIDINISEKDSASFVKESKLIASTTYGAPNSMSILLLSSIIYKSMLYHEQEKLKELLHKRSERLLLLLQNTSIKTYPYKEGFFITIQCENPFLLSEKLKEKSIYVVPTFKGIRVAISAISLDEIGRFVKQLRKVYDIC